MNNNDPSHSSHNFEDDRQYLAEVLEPRVLYSAAPIAAPVEMEVVESDVEQSVAASAFQSISEFAEVPTAEAGDVSAEIPDVAVHLLNPDDLNAMVAEAKDRWAAAGLSEEQLAALDQVTYEVVDLDGAALGYAEGSRIVIDVDAAESGWYVDETPADDSEFTGSTMGEVEGIDLLSVVVHEMGHIIGLQDVYESADSTNVMFGWVGEGERRLIADGQADGAEAFSLEGRHYVNNRVVWDGSGADNSFSNPANWTRIDGVGGDGLPGYITDTGATNAIIQSNSGPTNPATVDVAFTPEFRFDVLILRGGRTMHIENDLNLHVTNQQGDVNDIAAYFGQTNLGNVTNHTAGTVSTGTFTLAHNNGSGSEYNFTGGTVNTTGHVSVGNNGAGVLNIDGGDFNVTNSAVDLRIGQNTNAVGIVNLDSGTITLARHLNVAQAGTGTFNQNGGTLTVNEDLNIATTASTGFTGTVNLNGGTANLNHGVDSAAAVGTTAVFTIDGATVNVSGGNTEAALTGNGTFTFSSGVYNQLDNNFIAGQNAGSVATVTIDGTADMNIANHWNTNSGQATIVIKDNATVDIGANLQLANGADGSADITIQDSAVVTVQGGLIYRGGNTGTDAVRLTGGVLNMTDGNITFAAASDIFEFTGGTLKDVNLINGTTLTNVLTQSGGIFQIGGDDGVSDHTRINQAFTMTGGSLAIGFEGSASKNTGTPADSAASDVNSGGNDMLSVGGTFTAGGTLALTSPTGGWDSLEFAEYTIVDANSTLGTFSAITGGTDGTDFVVAYNKDADGDPGTTGGDVILTPKVSAELSLVSNGNEDGSTDLTFRIDLLDPTGTTAVTNGMTDGLDFDLALLGTSTATDGVDFSALPSTLTIASGSSFVEYTVTVTDDLLIEAVTESVNLQISNPEINGTSVSDLVTITTDTASGTITDNDTPVAELSVIQNGVDPNGSGGTATDIQYQVELKNATGQTLTNSTGVPITFDLTKGGSSTAEASDHGTIGQISVANGASSGVLVVTVTDDGIVEDDETVVATLSNASIGTISSTAATVTATITDADEAQVTIGDVTVDESGNMVFTATLDNEVEGGFSVDVTTTDVTALGNGVDYLLETSLFEDDFSSSAVSGAFRLFQSNLDGDWQADFTSNSGNPTDWEISGGQLTNPGVEAGKPSEGAVAKLFSVNQTDPNLTEVTISFDYSVGAGTTMYFHAIGLVNNPTFANANPQILNTQDQNGNIQETQREANYTDVSLFDGSDPTGNRSGAIALTGSGTYTGTFDLSAYPGISSVGDLDSIALAFGNDMTASDGSGAVSLDNVKVVATGSSSTTLRFLGNAGETQEFTVAITDDALNEGSETFTVSMGSASTLDTRIDTSDTATGTIASINAVDDTSYTVNEDDTLTTTAATGVLANDSDQFGSGSLVVNTTPVTTTSNGSLTLNADGSFTYTPTANFNGTDSFVYQVTDGQGSEQTATATITIAAVNDEVVIDSAAQAGTITESADSAPATDADPADATGTITFDDIDIETHTALVLAGASVTGGTTTISGAQAAALLDNLTLGAVTDNADGSGSVGWTYDVPNSEIDFLTTGDTVELTFTVQIDDGNGSTDTQDVVISIVGTNDGPIATGDTAKAEEQGHSVTAVNPSGNVLTNDSDPDDTQFHVINVGVGGTATDAVGIRTTSATGGTTVAGTYGNLVIGADGSYTYTQGVTAAQAAAVDALDEGDSDVETFIYEVSDSSLAYTRDSIGLVNSGNLGTFTAPDNNRFDDVTLITEVTLTTLGSNNVIFEKGGGTGTGLITNNGDLIFSVIGGGSFSRVSYDMVADPAGLGLSDGVAMTIVANYDVTPGVPAQLFINGVNVNDFSTVTGTHNTANWDGGDDGGVGQVGGANLGGFGNLFNHLGHDYSSAPFNGSITSFDLYTRILEAAPDPALTDTAQLVVTVCGHDDLPQGSFSAGAVEDGGVANATTGSNPSGSIFTQIIDPDADDTAASMTVTDVGLAAGQTQFGGATSFGGSVAAGGTRIDGLYGTLVIDSAGDYTYTLNQALADHLDATDTVVENFTVSVQGSSGGPLATTLDIYVHGANDAPVASDDTGAAQETGKVNTIGSDATGNVISTTQELSLSNPQQIAGGEFLAGVVSSLADTLNDSFAYDPEAPTSVLPDQNFDNNPDGGTRDGFSGDGPDDVILQYDLVATTLTGSNEVVIDLYGRSDQRRGEDDNIDIIFLDAAGDVLGRVDGQSILPNGLNQTPYHLRVSTDGAVAAGATVAGVQIVIHDTNTDNRNFGAIMEVRAAEIGDTDVDGDDGFTLTRIAAGTTGAGVDNVAAGSDGTVGGSGTATAGSYGTLTIGADGSYTYQVDNANGAVNALDPGETLVDTFTYTISDAGNNQPVDTADVTRSAAGVFNAFGTTGDGTFEAVFQPTDLVGNEIIFETGGGLGAGMVMEGADLVFSVTSNSGDPAATVRIVHTLSEGDIAAPLHVIATYDNTSKAALLYVNGVAVGTTTIGGSPTGYNGGDQAGFGQNGGANLGGFGGPTATVAYDANNDGFSNLFGAASWVAGAPTTFNFYDGDVFTAAQVAQAEASLATEETDTATLMITVRGANDDFTLESDIQATAVEAGGVANGTAGTDPSGNVLTNATDIDTTDVLKVTQVGSGTTADTAVVADSDGSVGTSDGTLIGTTSGNNGTAVAGSYGTLVMGADGTWNYTVDQAAADALDAGDSVVDTFTYEVTDGSFEEIGGVIAGEAEEFSRTTSADWLVIDTGATPGDNTDENAGLTAPGDATNAPLTAGFGGNVGGDEYVYFEEGAGSNSAAFGAVAGVNFLEYDISVETAGEWQLFVKSSGFNGISDSLYVTIVEQRDGPGGGSSDWYFADSSGNPASIGWFGDGRAESTNFSVGSSPMTWDLATGDYTLRIWAREDGVAVDSWALVNSAAGGSNPSGDGSVVSTACVKTETIDITVTGANDNPVLASIETVAATFTEDDPPLQITNTITVADVDHTTDADNTAPHPANSDASGDDLIVSATIQITAGLDSSEDVLAVAGALPAGITAGVYDASTGTLTLTGNATPADYQTALRQITYQNTDTVDPDNTTRTVTFTVNDHQGDSNSQTRDINVVDGNDLPTAVKDVYDETFGVTEDSPGSVEGQDVTPGTAGQDSDPEDGGNVIVVGYDRHSATGANVTIDANGIITDYNPNIGNNTFTLQQMRAGETLTDDFTYTIADQDSTVPDGFFTIDAFQLGGGSDDVSIGNTTEAEEIWGAIDAGDIGATGTFTASSTNGNTYNVSGFELGHTDTSVDYSGGWMPGTDNPNSIGSGSITDGAHFSIRAQTFLRFAEAGTYTIAVASDDGRLITMDDVDAPGTFSFDSSAGQIDGGTGSGTNQLRREAGTGHQASMGTFTVTAGQILSFDSFFWQGAGGQSFEIMIKKGVDTTINTGGVSAPDDQWELLADGVYNVNVSSDVSLLQGMATDTAEVCIHIAGVNDRPDAVDDGNSVVEGIDGVDAGIITGALRSNDTDIDDTDNTNPGATSFVNDDVTVRQIRAVTAGTGFQTIDSDATLNGESIVVVGQYGTLTINEDGTYTYDLDDANAAVQALNLGQTLVEEFEYTLDDNHTNVVTGTDASEEDNARLRITVFGSNDTPVAADDSASVVEDTTLSDTGNVITDTAGADTDVDNPTLTVKEVNGVAANVGTAVAGTYGSVTIDADGGYTYTLANGTDGVAPHNVQQLAQGETAIDTFTYAVGDGLITGNGLFDVEVIELGFGNGQNDNWFNNTVEARDLWDQVDAQGVTSSGPVSVGARTYDVIYESDTVTEVNLGESVDAGLIGDSDLLSSVGGGTANGPDRFSIRATTYLYFNEAGTYSIASTSDDGRFMQLTDVSGAPFGFTASAGQRDSFTAGQNFLQRNGGSSSQASIGEFTVAAGTTLQLTSIMREGNGGRAGLEISIRNGSIPAGANQFNVTEDNGWSLLSQGTAVGVAIANDQAQFTEKACDEATLRVTITGTNDEPVAVADTASVTETGGGNIGESATVSGDVSTNDTDIDTNGVGIEDSTLTVTGVTTGAATTAPSGGVGALLVGTYGDLLLNANGTYTYSLVDSRVDALDATDVVSEVFTYTVSDGFGSTDIATLTIQVNGANDDPVAVKDTASVTETGGADTGETASVSGSVVGNDTDVDDDDNLASGAIDNTSVLVAGVTAGSSASAPVGGVGAVVAGAFGDLVLNADGSYVYNLVDSRVDSLDTGDAIDEVFTYVINDGQGGSSLATLCIKVNGTNDDPLTSPDTGAVFEDGVGGPAMFSGQVGTIDVDDQTGDGTLSITTIDGAPVSAASPTVVTSTYGSIEMDASGAWVYTVNNALPQVQALDDGQSVTEVFTFIIADDDGVTATSTVTVTVHGENDPPVISGVQPEIETGGFNTATVIVPSITISDVDDGDIESATILVKGFVPGEDELSIAGGLPAGLTAVIDNNAGSITISGAASPGVYEAAIAQVQYTNTLSQPTGGARTVCVHVSDGEDISNVAEVQLNQGTSFVGILSIFRDLAETTILVGAQVGEQDAFDFDPLRSVSITPFYAGLTTPGATVEVVLRDDVGNEIGTATTFADPAGNWFTPVHTEIDRDANYSVEVRQRPNFWGDTLFSGVDLETLVVHFDGGVIAHPDYAIGVGAGDIIGKIFKAQTIEEHIASLSGF